MSETIQTLETKHNSASSIRVTLDNLAEHGHIGWNDDWGNRREAFFAALSSWDTEQSSLDGAFTAAFGDLLLPIRQLARNMYDHAYNVGNPLDTETVSTVKKPSRLRNSVTKTIEALKS